MGASSDIRCDFSRGAAVVSAATSYYFLALRACPAPNQSEGMAKTRFYNILPKIEHLLLDSAHFH